MNSWPLKFSSAEKFSLPKSVKQTVGNEAENKKKQIKKLCYSKFHGFRS